MRTRIAIAVVAVGILAAAGCSSDDTTSSQPATQEGLEAAALAANEAILANDAETSHSYLSADCKEKWSVGEWGANVNAGMMMVTAFMGLQPGDLDAGPVTVTEFTETEALVSSQFLGPDGEPIDGDSSGDGVRWIYEDGGWRGTSCESIEESMDSSDG